MEKAKEKRLTKECKTKQKMTINEQKRQQRERAKKVTGKGNRQQRKKTRTTIRTKSQPF